MKRLFALLAILFCSSAWASDITWTDKINGSAFTYTDANEIKTAVNSKLDESLNLSDVASAATAFTNIKQAATTTSTGVVELATEAEAAAITDTTRAITPAGLGAAYGLIADSAAIGLTDGSAYTSFSGAATDDTLDELFLAINTRMATYSIFEFPSAGISVSTGTAWDTSLGVTTTLGSPGSTGQIPTESAVRAAITAAGGMSNLSDDATPELGGDLGLNGHVITGMVIGTNIQAFDADLTTYAGITPSANAQTLLAHTFGQMRTDLALGTVYQYNVGFGANNIPQLTATPGTPDGTKFLRDDGTWQVPAGSGGIADIVSDTTPQLGGDLDTNGFSITGILALSAGAVGANLAASGAFRGANNVDLLTARNAANGADIVAVKVNASDKVLIGGTDSSLWIQATTTDTMTNKTIDADDNVFQDIPCTICAALSDESTDLTIGAAKATIRAPYAFTATGVRASVNTAPTGATIIVDINETGSTILSTKLSIDASELTSVTAAAAAVLSDTSIADDAVITFDLDQVGSTIAGKGAKVCIYGKRSF